MAGSRFVVVARGTDEAWRRCMATRQALNLCTGAHGVLDRAVLPALARIRQKGKRVALCSMRNCCARDLLDPAAHCRDFDPIWLDDQLDYLIRPNA